MFIQLPLDLFWFLSIELLSVLIGLKVFSYFFREDFTPPLSKILFAFGIGLGILSSLIVAIACLKIVYRPVLIGLIISLFIFVHKEMGQLTSLFVKSIADLKSVPLTKFNYLLIFLLLTAVISNFFFNYAPPANGKEVEANLDFPKVLLRDHQIIGRYDHFGKNYPFLLEMVYTLAMGVGGVLVSKLIHYSLGIFSALLVYQLTKVFIGDTASLLAAVIFYLMPVVSSVSGTANVDLGVAFYGLLTLYSLLAWIEKSSEKKWLFLVGWMSGLAWQSKITGMSIFPSVLVFIIFRTFFAFRTRFLESLKALFIISVLSFTACSPWLLKNYFFTRNPLFPFPVNFLKWEGHEMVIGKMKDANNMDSQYTFGEVLKMHNNILIGNFVYGPGPLPFAFLLPGLILGKRRNIMNIFIFGSLLFLFHNLIFKNYGNRFLETHYYILFYALFSILSAIGIERTKSLVVSQQSVNPSFINWLVAFLSFFPCWTLSLLFGLTRVPLFIGWEKPEEYLQRKFEYYDVVKFANHELPRDSKVVVLGDKNPFFYYWNVPIMLPSLDLLKEENENRILEILRKEKFTHICYFKNFYAQHPNEEILHYHTKLIENFCWKTDEWKESHFKEIYQKNGVVLYAIE